MKRNVDQVFNVPVRYDVKEQREIVAKVTLDWRQMREIVENFFNYMCYEERMMWIRKNVKKPRQLTPQEQRKIDLWEKTRKLRRAKEI